MPSPYYKENEKIKGTFFVRPYLKILRLVRDLDYLTFDELKIFAIQMTDYRKYSAIKTKIVHFREEKAHHKDEYKHFIDKV